MKTVFSKIGLTGKHANPEVQSTIASLVSFLQAQGVEVIMERHCAQIMPDLITRTSPRETLGEFCDLVIVVGGDGSLLDAARAIIDYDVPVVGVNRGRRGFLTDISPQALTQSLEPILTGEFHEEKRFLLEMILYRDNQAIAQNTALNEVSLHPGSIAKMIEFEVLIDNQFVYRQRSDGLICATPTGSTAYSLAGGGPILHPTLNAIVLVPMHPAVLSSRPIVVNSHSQIELHIMPDNIKNIRLSCDGQAHFNVMPHDQIIIQRYSKPLRLLHPTDYDYYRTLRTKLGWSA